ncbi:MAG: hypothetical protein ACR2RB_13065 [Gammaproteobacteria bacterium]
MSDSGSRKVVEPPAPRDKIVMCMQPLLGRFDDPLHREQHGGFVSQLTIEYTFSSIGELTKARRT